MSCKDMDRLIQLYVDQEINEQEHEELRHHIAGCESCLTSLTEMVTLVSSLDEIRQHELSNRPVPFVNHFLKWMVVTAVILLFVTGGPSLLTHRNTGLDQEAVTLDDEVVLPSKITVLATKKEDLHIPESGNIEVISPRLQPLKSIKIGGQTALIYPSAMPFLADKDQNWVRSMKRLVFVHVPDQETLEHLFSSVGIAMEDKDAKGMEETTFPTSIILTTGDHPRWRTFSFPENKQKVVHWFDKVASTSTIH
ncbi:anti-sigma factor family protein [Marininema halotolerans]|uniref:Anti-sigma-W factor RsiW n=1 Tax=Marininema halotolerans TaxID=1155944 RepID=A0A1I6PV74_9BACL|nr:zf-HC2 domain-containing protein [Marininema halotolerans]SFS44099.1 Putative zinc-finger [Marininema halotolerans]